ncbi:TetR/AcrR family transcriptional regulator [Kineosporia rhizophila]|uniref:TetR/AcrR family transcriptional regulator n=1 Tax=Kineosporia rhizophila TaxID=84633 RepID=UPI001E29D921|nr:TetR/AcrR family transcriptional regulator [Kineosporia rhizophila]MCE0537783.1 TetR/AcrR family transcriptional regulator [Kineosporia rhizophila]GLY15770.1 TetR family transcriptional regulator [Kineosporia sp. NBRC 101677]
MARTVLDRSDAVRALAGVFRKRGFESASLSVIQREAGLGRGSLYHFFPDGKTDMARAVLEQVGEWFEEQIFTPLRTAHDVPQAIEAMSREVADYFTSRESVCLFAAMTLGQEQDTFAEAVRAYFTDWVDALAQALRTGGLPAQEAADRALDAVAAIQGGLILARAYGDNATFLGIVARTEQHLLKASEPGHNAK